MLPVTNSYSSGMGPLGKVELVTISEVVPASGTSAQGRQEEFANTRIGNFLSDDAAPKDRDLDTLMHDDGLGWSQIRTKSEQDARREDATPTTSPAQSSAQSMEPISQISFDVLLTNQMQAANQNEQNQPYKGMSAGAYAQEMYTSVKNVMTLIST